MLFLLIHNHIYVYSIHHLKSTIINEAQFTRIYHSNFISTSIFIRLLPFPFSFSFFDWFCFFNSYVTPIVILFNTASFWCSQIPKLSLPSFLIVFKYCTILLRISQPGIRMIKSMKSLNTTKKSFWFQFRLNSWKCENWNIIFLLLSAQ